MKQFNSSKSSYGKNITKVESCDDDLYFNESYIIFGDDIKVNSIHASYDLSIHSSINCDTIDVHGALTVLGNITCNKLSAKKIICSGNIKSKVLIVDDEILADSLIVDNADLSGNLLINKSITVNDKFNSTKNVLVGEGVMATDDYYAEATAVVDYFDVDCKDSVNYIEISSEFKNTITNAQNNNMPFSKRLSQLINEIYGSIDMSDEEDEIVSKIKKLGDVQPNSFKIIHYVLDKIIDISYNDSIENLNQYLYVSFGLKFFPKSIKEYETLEPVFSSYINNLKIDFLDCIPSDAYEFSILLFINECTFDGDDKIADKIFSSIGIKYKTVKQRFANELESDNKSRPDEEDEISEEEKKELDEPIKPEVGKMAHSNAFGDGIIKDVAENYYVIDFGKNGIKKISKERITILN